MKMTAMDNIEKEGEERAEATEIQPDFNEQETAVLDDIIQRKAPYELLLFGNAIISSEGSAQNMRDGFELVKGYVHSQIPDSDYKSFVKETNKVLGTANTLMLRFETAKNYFAAGKHYEKMRELFDVGMRFGRYELVKDLSFNMTMSQQGLGFTRERYSSFLEKAITHIPMVRDKEQFIIDEEKLDCMLSEYESLNPDVDRQEFLRSIVVKQQQAKNQNTPKKLFLARQSGDPWLTFELQEEFNTKSKGNRKRIDELVKDYCSENSIGLIKKLQEGDHDEFFPISSSLYLAEQDKTRIVLKENLKLYLDFTTPDGYSSEKEIYELMRDKPHPNIIKYLGSISTGGIEFMKFEFFKGENLSTYTKLGNLLKVNESLGIVRKVADAIKYLHSKNILYTDVKDTNVMYDRESGEMRLLDFGMSRIVPEGVRNETRVTSLLSTPKYVPPEVGATFQYNSRSDVFQLGILLYELLHGRHPFIRCNLKEGDSFRESEIMKYSLANMCCSYDANTHVLMQNSNIRSLIGSALEKDPSRRITIDNFYQQLADAERSMLSR